MRVGDFLSPRYLAFSIPIANPPRPSFLEREHMIPNPKAAAAASNSVINHNASVQLPRAVDRQRVTYLMRRAGLTASRAELISKFAFQAPEAVR
jgi:hypothetical protein